MAATEGSCEWRKTIGDQNYIVSTSKALHSRDFIQSVFANPAVYWTQPISPSSLELMIEKSEIFGIYATPSLDFPVVNATQVGMARLVTDFVTFAYLTDVFVAPEHQGRGLGKWIVQCTGERALKMPEIRAITLFTDSREENRRFYEGLLGVKVVEPGHDGISFMMRRLRKIER